MCGYQMSVAERAEEGTLKWFGHGENKEGRLKMKIHVSEAERTRRPNCRGEEEVKKSLSNQGLIMQEGYRRSS